MAQPGAAPTVPGAGDGKSAYLLGVQYLLGDGVDQNLSLARDSLHVAALQGHPQAIETLRNLEAARTSKDVSWQYRYRELLALAALLPLLALLAWCATRTWMFRAPAAGAQISFVPSSARPAVSPVRPRGGLHGKRR